MVIGLEPAADLLSRHVRFLVSSLDRAGLSRPIYYFFTYLLLLLLADLGNATCTNGAATFTDSEAESFFHSDWLDEDNRH